MRRLTLAQLLGMTSLLLLIGLIVSVAWIGKLHFFDLKNNQIFLLNVYKSTMIVGQHFPRAPIQTVHGDTVHINFSKKKGGLVLLFDPTSCQPCLELVLNGLQHIHDNLIDSTEFPIYALSKDISLERLWQVRRAFRLDYQLGIITENDILPDIFFEQTPLIILVDDNNTILQCHYPIYGKEQFSIIFFTKLVFRHFPPLEVSTEGFKDSPLAQLQDTSLLEAVKGHHIISNPFRGR